MCHSWLAAGVFGFMALVVIRELTPLLREPGSDGSRSANGLLGTRLRQWFRGRIRPVVEVALAAGLTADHATMLQLVMSLVCGLAYAHGWMFTAGWLLIVSGTLDVLDGDMARRRGHDGPRGAFVDSVVDRYGEALVFAGLVAFFRNEVALWLVLSAWAGSFLVSYTRARAESLGIECREGLLQRPERYVILGGTSMLSTILKHVTCDMDGEHHLVIAGVGVLALLANVTAVQRIRSTLRRFA